MRKTHLVARVTSLVALHLVAGRKISHRVVADGTAVGAGRRDHRLVVLLVSHAHSERLGGAGQRNAVEGLKGGIRLAGLLILDKPHTAGGVGGLVRENLDFSDGAIGLEDGLEVILGNVGLEVGDVEVAELLRARGFGDGNLEGLVLDLTPIQRGNGCVGLALCRKDKRRGNIRQRLRFQANKQWSHCAMHIDDPTGGIK